MLQLLPLIILVLAWQLITGNSERLSFLFGSPVLIGKAFWNALVTGALIRDIYVTVLETVLGFLLGNIVGSLVGLGLWYSREVAKIARPYIVAIGSVPVFALAPMLIIWFGTGLLAKVFMSAFSTLIVAVVQAYSGAQNADRDLLMLMRTFGATRNQVFTKVIVPSSLTWVFASYKINIGFALLGTFIAEFISSERGLGHLIIRAGGLYNIPLVFVGIFAFITIALILNYVIGTIERRFLSWKSFE